MTHEKDQITSAWVITKQHQLKKIDATGSTQDKSSPNFATALSFGVDQTLWVLPENSEPSVNQLLYSEDEGHNWITMELQSIKVVKLAATHLGSCFVVTPQGSVYLIQKSGQGDLIFAEGTANDIAVSPEGYIWVISREKKPGGGNLVFWCTYGNFSLQPSYGQPVAKKIAAGIDGAARIVTIGGEVASLYVNRMGGLETPGGEQFAKDISTSKHSSTIWVIGSEIIKKKKQNVLKCWNPDTDPYMNWHTIHGIEPYSIAGGF